VIRAYPALLARRRGEATVVPLIRARFSGDDSTLCPKSVPTQIGANHTFKIPNSLLIRGLKCVRQVVRHRAVPPIELGYESATHLKIRAAVRVDTVIQPLERSTESRPGQCRFFSNDILRDHVPHSFSLAVERGVLRNA